MGILPPLQHPLEATVESRSRNKSVGGFLGNIWGDVGEFVTGLGALGGSLLNDAVGAVQYAIPGGGDPDFKTDDLVMKGLPAIADMYKKNYGSLGDFVEYLYKDPLGVAGDALTVASLGGYGAAKGAQLAAKTAYADDLSRLHKGTVGLDDLSAGARLTHKILPGAGAEGKVPLGGYRPVLNRGSGGWNVVPEPRHMNPYRRMMRETLYDKVLGHSLDPYKARAAQLAEDAKKVQTYGEARGLPVTPDVKSLGNASDDLTRMLDTASNYNTNRKLYEMELDRVPNPRLSDHMTKKAVDRLMGFHTTKFIRNRNQFMRELDEIFEERKGVLTPEDMESFHALAQSPTKSYGRMQFDEIVQDLAAGGQRMGEPMAKRLAPHLKRIEDMAASGAEAHRVQAAQKYVENLTERIGIEEAIARGEDVDAIAETVSRVRLWIDDRLTAPLMDANPDLLDYDTALNRSFLPTRLDNEKLMKAAKKDVLDALNGGEAPEPQALASLFPHDGGREFLEAVARGEAPDELIDEWVSVLDEPGGANHLDDAVKKLDMQAPLYFPHMDPHRVKFMDFLMPRKSKAMLAGQRSFLRHNKGWLYEQMRYISDPVEAYSRRVAQVHKYLEAHDVVQAVVKNFGREITQWDDAVDNFEKVFHPEAARILLSTKVNVEREVSERIEALQARGVKFSADSPEGIEDAYADGIVAGLKATQKQVDEAAAKGVKIWAVPNIVADRLDDYAKVRLGWKARMFWDAPINVWRSLVLAGSPRWVFYNMLGNTTFLKMQGGRLSDVLHLAISPKFRQSVEDMLSNAVPEEVGMGVHSGFMQQQYVTHYGSAENTRVAQFYKWLRGTTPVKSGHWLTTNVQKFNQFVENTFRMASFIEGLDAQAAMKGIRSAGLGWLRTNKRLRELVERGIDPQDAVAALDEVNYFFNDYNALGPWERGVIRRFISPFYSFYKHIVKLLVTFPVHSPGRANVMNNLAKLSSEMEAMGPMPDWLEGAVPTENFGFLGDSGNPLDVRFLNSRGINPFAALAQGPEDFMFGQMNPVLKTVYEQATGESTLTGEPFSAPDVIQPFGSDQQYRFDPETMTMQPVDRVAPGLLEHVAGSIPQYGLARDLVSAVSGEAGARYSTGETINQPGTDVPMFPTDPLQEVLQFIGLSTTDYNLPRYQQRRMQEVSDALKSLLSRNPGLLAP